MWKPCVEALKKITSPDPNIQAACKRLFDVCSRKDDIVRDMKSTNLNDETKFNWFVATRIIQNLSGGICMVNKKPRDSSANEQVATPREIGKGGLGIGKKVLLLSSNTLRVVTKTQTSDPEKLRPPNNSGTGQNVWSGGGGGVGGAERGWVMKL